MFRYLFTFAILALVLIQSDAFTLPSSQRIPSSLASDTPSTTCLGMAVCDLESSVLEWTETPTDTRFINTISPTQVNPMTHLKSGHSNCSMTQAIQEVVSAADSSKSPDCQRMTPTKKWYKHTNVVRQPLASIVKNTQSTIRKYWWAVASSVKFSQSKIDFYSNMTFYCDQVPV